MYWRIKTVDPKVLAKKWGLPVALGLSLFVNVLMIATRPPGTPKTTGEEKLLDWPGAAREVTRHLIDSSYINYEDNTKRLLGGELTSSVVKNMQSRGDLPKDNVELQATLEGLKARRQITAVHFREVTQGDPDASTGLIPIDVKGDVVSHSADESGPSGPQPFHFVLLMGKNNNDEPMVGEIKEK